MAIKRDTPLSTSPDPGNMQDYGKYQGSKMKATKVAPLGSRPVNMKKLSENVNAGEQRRAAQYAQEKAIEKKKSRTNKILMGTAAAATAVGEYLTDKYFPRRK